MNHEKHDVLMTTLGEMLDRRPVDPEELETHKERLLDEARAHRLRELGGRAAQSGECSGQDR